MHPAKSKKFLIKTDLKIILGLVGAVVCLTALTGTGYASVKKWPEGGFRGISLPLVAPVDGNSQNPGQFLAEATFQKIAQWRVNCVRLVISFDAGSIWDVPGGTTIPPIPSGDPMAPYRTNLAALRVVLPLAEKYGISLIILCEPLARYVPFTYEPGHATGGWQDGYIQLWKNVAQEFGSRPGVIGYDLLNEPHGADEAAHWRTVLLPLVRNEIRTVDTNTYLIVEPWEWSFPSAFAGFAPLADAKVVYSFHHYTPHGYTHQKIYNYTGPDYDDKPYPGLLCTFTPPPVLWDKVALENSMQAVFDFQATNNAIIWVGEFSVLRWAPGAAQWVKDSIEIFEKHHISWNYHMYGGWNGWNPTFDAVDPSNNNLDGGKGTDRLQMLLDGWQKNPITLAAPRLNGGQFQFDATGLTVGRTNLMQVSTNLISWTSFSTNIATNFSMTLTNAAGSKSQFFRLVQLP